MADFAENISGPSFYTERFLLPKRRRGKPMDHVPDGFPHINRSTGHCQCLQECCNDDQGCTCKNCPCRIGSNHTPLPMDPIDQLLAEVYSREGA